MNKKSVIFLALFIFCIANVYSFTPSPTSPLAQGVHPRLHITPDNIAEMRAKMAGSNRADYQKFVNLAVQDFSNERISNDAGGPAADYHALIYVLGAVSGINYGGKSIDDFGRRAVEIMLADIATQVDCGSVNSGKVENFHNEADIHSIIARAYDWTWHHPAFTSPQKQAVAIWLANAGTCLNPPGETMSSSYHENYRFPWYIGLSFYGDGFADADASILVDKFVLHMLNGGPLDAHNFVAQINGGPPEISAYAHKNSHSARHIMYLDGWLTATGQNYLTQGTTFSDDFFLRYQPKFFTYLMSPWDPYRFLKWGQMSVDDDPGPAMPIRMLAGILKSADPDMAGLASWFLVKTNINNFVSDLPQELFQNILWGDRSVSARSPSSLNLSLTEYFAGLGMVFARSGFDSKEDLALVLGAPPYKYQGHTWETAGGGTPNGVPLGFSIDKYGGPLIFKKVGYHRSEGAYETQRQNIMRFNDPVTISTDQWGGFSSTSGFKGTDIRILNPEHSAYRGGVERYYSFNDNGQFDYAFTDLKRHYESSRIRNYTRQYVLSRPGAPMQSDYLVIFDRVETTRQDIIKRWEINMAYDPVINGIAIPIREGKTAYTNANQIIISNNLPDPYNPSANTGAHGRAFVNTLLPKQVKMDKFGGMNHEFERDTGVPVIDSSNTNDLRQVGAFYVGAYTVEVIPTQNNAKENFLHVIQTADANLVSSMVQTSLIESTEGKMQGAYITKTTGQDNTVVMFAKNEEVLDLSAQTITYRYGAGSLGTTKHIISDLKANHPYTITDRNIATGATTNQIFSTTDLRTDFAKQAVESAAGVLSFTTNANAEHEITITQQGASINIAPHITLITNKITYAPLSSIILTALVNDQDGTISKVEFYRDSTLLNSDLTSPFAYTWPAVPAGDYILTAKAYDNNGAATTSNAISIIVATPPDITAPVVSITSPANNIIIGPNPLTITASASDNVAVTSVDFKVDGASIGIDSSSPYIVSWTPPGGLTLGNHIITAEAKDAAGNKKISPNLVIVYSPTGQNKMPIGSFDEINSKSEVRGWAYDPDNNLSQIKIQVYVDGPAESGTQLYNLSTNIGRGDINSAYGISGSHGFEFGIPAQYKDAKLHEFYIYAFDLNDPTKKVLLPGSPKMYDSSSIDTSAPTIIINFPSSNSILMGNVTVNASAFDDRGVMAVQFKLNGVNLGTEDTIAPYSIIWNTATGANGSKILTATARDSAGNQGTSVPITVTTKNEIIDAFPQPSPTPPPTSIPTHGSFDEITINGVIKGWTLDSDQKNSGNQVHIYFEGKAGEGGIFITGYRTNIIRGDINHIYNASDNHGFEYIIPAKYRDGVTRSAYVYGADISNPELLTLLSGSPKSFTLPAINGNSPPFISLNSPYNGQSFIPPASISLIATASDLDGNISKVEFYQGNFLISTDSVSPFSIAWNGVALGNYILTAKAYDNNGVVYISSPVSIKVNVVVFNPGDINQDEKVNLEDIVLIVNDFGKTSGFNPAVDLSSAGVIDIFDVMVVVKNWGRSG